ASLFDTSTEKPDTKGVAVDPSSNCVVTSVMFSLTVWSFT
ncbi:hypothetical protein D037_0773B, partial [Vibrio parahaemolyticus IDH02640]